MAQFIEKQNGRRRNIIFASAIFLIFACCYIFLAWLSSGGENWWVIDLIDGQNVFYGDDAYRFFLTRSVWVTPDLFKYNFVLPGQLLLDGVITWLVNGEIYFARISHALVGAGTLTFLYLTGRALALEQKYIVLAIAILGFMPRFAIMNLSFYGEVWLAFFLSISLLLYVRQKWMLLAAVAAWLPLMRPEGIFFLGPLALFFLANRRFKEFFLLIAPGFVFFIYLNLSFDNLVDYHYWRIELRRILS